MSLKTQLTIVIPFYNEAKNIPLVLDAYRKFYKKHNKFIHFELVCINNGSVDDSRNVFQKLINSHNYPFVKLVNLSVNKGYGYGIKKGLIYAKGSIVAWTHADMQTDPIDVFRAYEEYVKYGSKHVIVKGTRIKRPLNAYLLSLGMAFISSILLKSFFYEINAQPKLFHRSLIPLLSHAPDDFSLDLYFLYLCKKKRYIIKTIPVLFKKRIYGESKWAYSFISKYRTIHRTVFYINSLRKYI